METVQNVLYGFQVALNVPTLSELGYKQHLITGWLSFFAPTGIPEDVEKVWVAATEKAFKNPELKVTNQSIKYLTS
jgi:tripartite-type tricarboxylate transporter receptor subunit TctC